MIGKNRWKNEDYDNNPNYINFFDSHSLKAKENPEINEDDNKAFLLKSYSLDEFIDEETIQDKLKDFRAFIKVNGLIDIGALHPIAIGSK